MRKLLTIILALLFLSVLLSPTEVADVSAPTETRYFRDATGTGSLGTAQTSSHNGFAATYTGGGSQSVGSEFKVYKVSSSDQETLIQDWTWIGTITPAEGNVEVYKSNTWNCPQTDLLSTDRIRVYLRVYVVSVTSQRSWDTEALGAVSLDSSTWTIYVKMYRLYNEPNTRGDIHYGVDTDNTRIENFKWSTNSAPTNDQLSLDLTGASYKGSKTLLCGKQDYKFVYKASDAQGVTDITYAQIQLDPSGKNVILRATRGSGDAWTFSEQSDPSNYVTLNTGGSSHSTSGNQKTFNFLVTINWAWGDSAETVTVRCYVIDSQSASDQDDYTNIFGVEAHLAFSSLTVNDYKVNPSQSLTFTWTKYYNGTSITPPDGNYNDAVKLSGVTKGTDSSTVSGQCSVSFSAESSVNSYSYTVWASYNVSYGSFPAVIVNDLLAELSSVNGTSGTYQTLVVANFTWDYNNSAAHGISAYVWDGSICVGEATSNSTGFALLTLNQTLHGSGSLTVNGTDTDGIKVNSPLSLPYNITVSGLEVLPDAEYASGKSGSVIVNFKNVGELNATALKLENVSVRWKFLTATGTLVWSYMTGISDVNGNTWRNATYSILPAGFTVSAFYTFRTEIVQSGSEWVLATMDKSVYVALSEGGVPLGPGGQLKLTIEPYAVDAPAGTSTVIELPIKVEGVGTFEIVSVTADLAWVQCAETLPKKMSTLLSTGPLTIKLTATPTSEDVYKCRVTVKVKADSQTLTTSTYLTISTYAKAPIPSAEASAIILVGLAGLFGFLMLSGRRKRKGEY